MVEKNRPKLADLLQFGSEVELTPGKMLSVRPLNLDEMVTLFLKYQRAFIGMYATAQSAGDSLVLQLGPFLAAAPDLVATIIAIASDSMDEDGAVEIVKRQMPATVQLIALEAIWRTSVPDPKKAKELLSGVMAQLQNAQVSAENQNHQPTLSTTT